MKLWKHRNGTISIIWDLHISLSIADCIEREKEREAISICAMVKTQKLYYLHHMRSAYFPTNRKLHKERERERARQREIERESELTAYLATSSEIWTHIWCLCALHLGHFIWQLGGFILQLIWVLHLKMLTHIWSWSLHLTSSWGYIWQLIWVLHLKIWTHILYSLLHLTSSGGYI